MCVPRLCVPRLRVRLPVGTREPAEAARKTQLAPNARCLDSEAGSRPGKH
jgi:hypothetical protein